MYLLNLKSTLLTLTAIFVALSSTAPLAIAQSIDISSMEDVKLKQDFLTGSKAGTLNSNDLLKKLSAFSSYPAPAAFKDSIYYVNDAVYGNVPFKLIIPKSYNPLVPNALILLLHGAVKASSFQDALPGHTNSEVETDPFVNALRKKNYIIVMPYADPKKNFDWVNKGYGKKDNQTFNSLINLLTQVKSVLNVDDNRVYAFGHSDGSDGAFALDIYKSYFFAGFASYNSMFNYLFAKNLYLRNTVNRPLYVVHSDLDDLRPMLQTRAIVKLLDSLKAPISYKEYLGYQHQDKHLMLDFNNSIAFMNSSIRNPFQKNLYRETNDLANSGVDWICIKQFDLLAPKADWHKTYNVKAYNKKTKSWYDNVQYYSKADESAAIMASFSNNIFTIQTSRVTQFEILISPAMVNMAHDVIVILNGKQVLRKKVNADNDYTLSAFSKTHDRKALWVNNLNITINAEN